MVDFFSVLIVILMTLVAIGVPMFFLILKYWRFQKTTNTLVLVEDTKRTHGVAIGKLISKETGRNGRVHITMLPLFTENPKPVMFISENNKIDVRPGTWIKGRDVIRVFPNSATDWYSNMFKNIEVANAESHIVLAQKEGLNRQQAHLVDMGEGELSRQNIGLQQSFMQQLTKSQTKEEKTNKPGTYPTASSSRDIFT